MSSNTDGLMLVPEKVLGSCNGCYFLDGKDCTTESKACVTGGKFIWIEANSKTSSISEIYHNVTNHPPTVDKPGYHITPIVKGVLGELSKIQEELDELKDAEAQDVRIMQQVELSDLYGAIEAYLTKHHVGLTMADIAKMAETTRRAFENGRRS